MKKIVFIANNNVGTGFSGGDRIFIEFLKNWKDKADLVLFGSEEAIEMAKKRGVDVKFIQTDKVNKSMPGGIFDFISHVFRRTSKGLSSIKKNREILKNADYVYSVSDFYPDFIPAFYLKLKNPKIKWIAGYYLFAPHPFQKDSPYKGKQWLRGFFYWFTQLFSHFLVKKFADYVFVTSEPDVKKFVNKRRDKSRIVVVQGGVDITESEKYLKSENVIPVKDRKYDACFVGRFHYQKGVLELVSIWKKVCEKRKDSKLAMVGNGPLEREVRKKIKDFGLEKNIDLLGFKDGQEKYEVFKQSKIILHPATYDSGGMAVAEGMAWGLPGVSFDLESLKTYYPKGMVKTPKGDENKFAENILELLSNRDLYEEKSREAHDLIVSVWDWKKRAAEILSKVFEI